MAKKPARKKKVAKKSPANKATKKTARPKSRKSTSTKAASSSARASRPAKATKASTAKKSAKTSKAAGRTQKKPIAKKKVASKQVPKRPRFKGASAIGIRTQHVDFLSYKVDQLRKFYGEVLELPIDVTDVDGLSYVMVQTSESSTLGFMPPHPDMRGERPIPREPTLYFVVKNVDIAYSQLSAKGVAFMGPPEEMPWGYRVLTTTDPEGRTIMLASKMATKG